MELKDKAAVIAEKAHRGMVRKFGPDAGKSYYDTHVKRVVRAVSEISKPAAELHDVVEDTDLTIDDLLFALGGAAAATIRAVGMLTRHAGEAYDDYVTRLIDGAMGEPVAGAIALEVKFADLMDNSSTLPPDKEKLRDRYSKAMRRVYGAINELKLKTKGH